jgi:hypothetical protein
MFKLIGLVIFSPLLLLADFFACQGCRVGSR